MSENCLNGDRVGKGKDYIIYNFEHFSRTKRKTFGNALWRETFLKRFHQCCHVNTKMGFLVETLTSGSTLHITLTLLHDQNEQKQQEQWQSTVLCLCCEICWTKMRIHCTSYVLFNNSWKPLQICGPQLLLFWFEWHSRYLPILLLSLRLMFSFSFTIL